MKKYLQNIGKILYKTVEIPFKVITGYYAPENQEKIKEIGHLEKQLKNLDYELMEIELKSIRLDQIIKIQKYLSDLELNKNIY